MPMAPYRYYAWMRALQSVNTSYSRTTVLTSKQAYRYMHACTTGTRSTKLSTTSVLANVRCTRGTGARVFNIDIACIDACSIAG